MELAELYEQFYELSAAITKSDAQTKALVRKCNEVCQSIQAIKSAPKTSSPAAPKT